MERDGIVSPGCDQQLAPKSDPPKRRSPEARDLGALSTSGGVRQQDRPDLVTGQAAGCEADGKGAESEEQQGGRCRSRTLLNMLLETCRQLAGGGDAVAEIAGAIAAWTPPAERVAVALGALRALPRKEAALVLEAATNELEGDPPGLSFTGTMAEAHDWAAVASADQLRAILWIAYRRLYPGSQRRFWSGCDRGCSAPCSAMAPRRSLEWVTPEERRDFFEQVSGGRR